MYDAIVVGARCAGAATAMLLARKGHRVLLVDRGHFPSDMRLCTLGHRRLLLPAVEDVAPELAVAEAVDDALCGRRPWEDALADYEGQRNHAAMPKYEFTYAQSSLEPRPPPVQDLLRPCVATPRAPTASSASSPGPCRSRTS